MTSRKKCKAPRGTHDIFGMKAFGMSLMELKAKEIFRRFGFEEIRTPIFEESCLFMRSIGQSSDIVEKEMYIFEDRKGRKLALRPEGTAALVRALIEHKLDISNPSGKFFYSGEMFRYERPQFGRYRQFYQIGAEFFGNSSPAADVEIIVLAQDLLASLGVTEVKLHINSLGCQNCRPTFKYALTKYFNSKQDLCKDCLRRLEKNPLRLLDCKIDSDKFIKIPQLLKFLCKDCEDNFNTVQSLLKRIGKNYKIDGRLVRGLDYYTRTVFEIHSNAIGSRNVLAAGGRYDSLVKELGGQDTPAVGFALGSERVLFEAEKSGFFSIFKSPEKIFIAIADQTLFGEAFSFAIKRAREGLKNNTDFSIYGPINRKSLRFQLKFANKIKASKTIIFAKSEFENGKVLVKNMKTKTQAEILITDL
ncbi:MAG: histidine--tRNA ligase [Endomicrobium sp.]|jgi:histidyl-tRNA synthetase|nr:histidine--tRNA ligase [Endomicrobium sp.]